MVGVLSGDGQDLDLRQGGDDTGEMRYWLAMVFIWHPCTIDAQFSRTHSQCCSLLHAAANWRYLYVLCAKRLTGSPQQGFI